MEWNDWVGIGADIVGLLGMFFALYAAVRARQIRQELEAEKKRQDQPVKIVLRAGSETIDLPYGLRRGELTRQEILGMLGMIPMKEPGKRYSLKYLSNPKFRQQVDQALDGKGHGLITIHCDKEELDQFDVVRTHD